MKHKVFFVVAVLIFILIVGTILLAKPKENKDVTICKSPYTIKCYDYKPLTQDIIKENVSCTTDKDCLELNKVCNPGIPSLANCIGFDMFCGEDNTCKGCCPS